jgi:hypothetical protein
LQKELAIPAAHAKAKALARKEMQQSNRSLDFSITEET